MSIGFPFDSAERLLQKARELGAPLPWHQDLAPLAGEVRGLDFTLKNPLVVQPMEGCDGTADGAPDELTFRRYRRFAAGGAGLIWLEAIAVREPARANPRQLMITEGNAGEYRRLNDMIRETALRETGREPLLIAQLTHSGRFSKPGAALAPIRACKSRELDARQHLSDDYPVITDEELRALPEDFVRAARLSHAAGFDGVDLKACHLYLTSELLGALERPGPYGGSYENRARLLLDIVRAVREGAPRQVLAARINLYDGIAGNFGVGEELRFEDAEPLRLVRGLAAEGITLLNLTMGTPYVNPHVNRPYATGGYEPPEHPLQGVARLLDGCGRAQRAVPHVVCVATGLSYLREHGGHVAAGLLAGGVARAVGFGRMAFAYPDFALDLLRGGLEPCKCCITCGLCTKLMRAGGRTGCPVRDAQGYREEYRALVQRR